MSAITGADDLEGLLVISLEQAVAAPYAAGRLADAGARVAGGGLGGGLGMTPTPPVRKKVNWPGSRRSSPRMMLVHMTKEKSSLSFSYSERQTFL